MKKILISLILCTAGICAGAQTSSYSEKYDLLVSKLGPAGVGVETVLNNWEKEDSTDVKMLIGKFNYYFTKSQSSTVEPLPVKKYLGNAPVVTLKDSLDNDVNYFQVTSYDDELFGTASKYLDRALEYYPGRLDLRFLKAASLIAYEKESPDMALAFLTELIDDGMSGRFEWEYPDVEVDDEFFRSAVQEYCYTFFNMGTPMSFTAFRSISEKMLEYDPKDTLFLANMGSYYFVALKDYKKALSYYRKVLKIDEGDYTAIKNTILIARTTKDVKLEKKYLPLLAEYGTESEKLTAKARLQALESKK